MLLLLPCPASTAASTDAQEQGALSQQHNIQRGQSPVWCLQTTFGAGPCCSKHWTSQIQIQ